jgi:hypothetical protein
MDHWLLEKSNALDHTNMRLKCNLYEDACRSIEDNNMAAVRNVSVAFGLVALTNKPLELGTFDVAWKQIISTLRYYIRNIYFKSRTINTVTIQIVEVAFRDLTQIRILLNDSFCKLSQAIS